MATIKKGTYRFNDVIANDGSANGTYNLSFKITTNWFLDIDNLTIIPNTPQTAEYNNIEINGGTIKYSDTIVYMSIEDTYWDYMYQGMLMFELTNAELMKGYGQIITIETDQTVDDTFATWFEANAKPYTESTSAVEITYKGETISLEAGETIALHTSGKKLTEDLVIKANATSSGGSYEEYNGEVVIS